MVWRGSFQPQPSCEQCKEASCELLNSLELLTGFVCSGTVGVSM